MKFGHHQGFQQNQTDLSSSNNEFLEGTLEGAPAEYREWVQQDQTLVIADWNTSDEALQEIKTQLLDKCHDLPFDHMAILGAFIAVHQLFQGYRIEDHGFCFICKRFEKVATTEQNYAIIPVQEGCGWCIKIFQDYFDQRANLARTLCSRGHIFSRMIYTAQKELPEHIFVMPGKKVSGRSSTSRSALFPYSTELDGLKFSPRVFPSSHVTH